MIKKVIYIFIFSSIFVSAGVLAALFIFGKGHEVDVKKIANLTSVFRTPTPTPTLTPLPSIPPTEIPVEYTISFDNVTRDTVEGGSVSFTWSVGGGSTIIHKSAVYFGTTGTKGILAKDIAPMETNYTEVLKDFINGDYTIPMRFVGSTAVTKAATYYARAYALIDGKNYWSDEHTFKVNPPPKNEIRVINFPDKVKLGENTAFTWEIVGPVATTTFTAIVGEKNSKSGNLDDTTDLTKTPYRILVKDFTGGPVNIPLRFVGNAVMPEYGKYYFRALAVINGKNIWSPEYTLSVE